MRDYSDAQLYDPETLMGHLLEASAHARGTVDHGFARLLQAAAHTIQQQLAEVKVQRGLAIASQTLASELAITCENLRRDHGNLGASRGLPPAPPHASQAPAVPAALAAPVPQNVGGGSMVINADADARDGTTRVVGNDVPYGAAPGNGEAGGSMRVNTWAAETTDPFDARGASVNVRQNTFTSSPPPALDVATGSPSGGPEAEAERAVDRMVYHLKQRFKQSGVTLPLEKQTGTLYRLGSRKLQLSVRNSRLMVRVGSNFSDFLEYLSMAAL